MPVVPAAVDKQCRQFPHETPNQCIRTLIILRPFRWGDRLGTGGGGGGMNPKRKILLPSAVHLEEKLTVSQSVS